MYLEFWRLLEYIDQNIGHSTEKFEEIDLHEPRFGTINDENGNEMKLLFIKNGQIFGISISKLNEMEQKFSKNSIFIPEIEQ